MVGCMKMAAGRHGQAVKVEQLGGCCCRQSNRVAHGKSSWLAGWLFGWGHSMAQEAAQAAGSSFPQSLIQSTGKPHKDRQMEEAGGRA